MVTPDKAPWHQAFEEGWRLGSAGDIDGAIERFRTAADLAPNEPNPHYQLGFSYMLQRRYGEALAPLKRTDSLTRGFFLVQTYVYLCEQAVLGGLSSSAVGMLLNIQHLIDVGRVDTPECLRQCERAVELAPTNALAHYYLGKALFKINPSQAETALRRSLDLAPDDTTAIDALAHLGFLRESAGDQSAARDLWQAAVNRDPDNIHNSMTRLVLEQRFGAA